VDVLYSIHPSYYPDIYGNTDVSLSILRISGNFIYNFILPDKNWRPFAGGGLHYGHGFLSIDTGTPFGDISGGFSSGVNLQLLGGIEKPLNNGKALRGEIRFGPFGTAILAGLSF
jgi:hypothetical protein